MASKAFSVPRTFHLFLWLLLFELCHSASANLPPVAEAGDDLGVSVGMQVLLDGSRSTDPDDDALTYAWELVSRPPASAAILVDSNTVAPGFLVDVPGTYEAELRVSDGELDSPPDRVLIHTQNSPPVAEIHAPTTVMEDARIVLDGTASSDVDNDSLSYDWVLVAKPPSSGALVAGARQPKARLHVDLPGSYTIGLTVSDGQTSSEQERLTIVVQALANHPPAITSFPVTHVQVLTEFSYDVDASDPDGDALSYHVEHLPAGMAINSATGLIQWIPEVSGYFGIYVRVTDARGANAYQYFNLLVEPDSPGQPGGVPAPSLQPLPFPGYFDRNRFLIESIPPVQTDALIGSFTPGRVSGVASRVVDAQGKALSGVKISIAGRPEYGSTLTRNDGRYRLLFDGGDQQQLVLAKDGYVTAGHVVQPVWKTDQVLEDGKLVVKYPRATELYSSIPAGSLQSVPDNPAPLSPVLLFDTSIAVFSGSSSIALPSSEALYLRLTDVSRDALPAPLPKAWADSSVVALTADTFDAGLRFAENMPLYLPNTQQFPIGTSVPAGRYTQEKGRWQPAGTGHVLQLVGVENGMAELSLDAAGTPLDATRLAQLGISDSERIWLAQHHAVGVTLVRTSLNGTGIWAAGLPVQSLVPDEKPPVSKPHDLVDVQPLVEQQLAIEGAPYQLHYSSGRMPGYAAARTLVIPLTGTQISEHLQRVEWVVRIAGRTYRSTLSPAPELTHTFEWDGLDLYGRQINSLRDAQIEVNHYYDAGYELPPENMAVVFGDSIASPPQVTQTATQVKVTRRWHHMLGIYTPQYTALGGWSLNVHHAWQRESGRLFLGTGDTHVYELPIPRHTDNGRLEQVIDLQEMIAPGHHQSLVIDGEGAFDVAGGEKVLYFSPASALEGSVNLNDLLSDEFEVPVELSDIAIWKGDILLTDRVGNRLLRLRGSEVDLLFSMEDDTECVDGVFCEPVAVAVGRSGDVVVAAQDSRRIYRWVENQGLRDFAGTGEAGQFTGNNGDGGSARLARFGQLGDMVWDEQGSLYVIDNYPGQGYRIRHIDPLGIITTVLREVTSSRMANSLAMDYQGVLIVGENNCQLRMHYPDGSDSRLDLSVSMDGDDYCQASPDALALHPDGSLYLSSDETKTIHHLLHRNVAQIGGLSRVKVPDTPEAYWFDAHGRHVKTTDTVGGTQYSFEYDPAGYLSRITDAGGQALTIDRDPQNGNIVLHLPNGEDVNLVVGADGYLSSVQKANGDVWSWQYGAAGRLIRVQDPAGNARPYYYTPYGGSTPTPYNALPGVSDDTPPIAGDSSLVATLPGEFGVTANGSANYNIPIEVPPGRGGMTPKIALQYNSQGGNGLLGVGWSLSGLSTVHRCNRTLAQDNRLAGVELERADALCLDGRRMRRVSGAQGEVGSVYRLEVDDYTKIEMLRDASSGRAYFKAWSKSGEIMEYGRSADARVDTPSDKVQRWALNRVTDTTQNYFTVQYYKNTSSGEHHVIRIDYTGNNKVPNAVPHSSIRFGYEGRPDTSFGYLAQTKISSTTRLKQITVYEGSAFVRRYAFDYLATDFTNPRSRLGQIRECMNAAETQCIAPTLVEWYSSSNPKIDAGFGASSVNSLSTIGDFESRDAAQVLDFNGDGIADLAYPKRNGGRVVVDLHDADGTVTAANHLESTETTPSVATGPWPYAPFIAMDVDADGYTDILIPQAERQNYDDGNGDPQSAWKITGWKKLSYRSEGIVSEEITLADTANSWGCDRWSQAATHCFPVVLDANGDGIQDMLFPRIVPNALGLAELRWDLLLNSASSPGEFAKAPDVDNLTGHHQFMVIDMNGDGMQDLFSVNNHLFLSRGDHFDQINLGWDSPAYNKKSLVIDINGDGYQDLVWFANKGIKYRLNLGGTRLTGGTGSFADTVLVAPLFRMPEGLLTDPEEQNNDPQSANPIDYDKDGVTDIVLAHKHGGERNWWVLLTRFDASGNPRFEAIDTGVNAAGIHKNHPQVADFDGDGFDDLLYGRNSKWELRKRVKNRGDLIRRITAGRGRTNDVIAIEYQPLTKGIHTALHGSLGAEQRYFQAPLFVVSEVWQDAGQGGGHLKQYHYEGASVHTQGRGFQGFARQIITDVTSGLVETQTFKQTFPYTGSLMHKAIYTINNEQQQLLTEISNTWKSTGWTPVGGRIEQPYVTLSIEKHYDLATGQLLDTRETAIQERDIAGNIKKQQVVIRDELTGKTHIKTTQSTYQNNGAHWLLGRLAESRVTHSGSAYGAQQVMRKSKFTYHMTAGRNQRPTGLLNCEIVEPDQTAYKLTKCYTYDNYGNLETTTTTGEDIESRSETNNYDGQGRFPQSSTNALGHSESYRYNSKFGFRTSLTGPNGLVTSWTPDALGRLQQETRADDTKTSINYQWGADNCPANTVYQVHTTTSGAPDQYQCFDKKDRAIGEAVRGFDGQWRRVDTEYDNLGRVSRVSRSHIPVPETMPAYWTVTSYDILDRPTTINSPVTGTTVYEYGIYGDPPKETHTKGQSMLVTNGLGQQTLIVNNAQGQKLAVRDALDNWIDFTYDPVGNTTSVTDPDDNQIITTYNLRGEKIRVDDPDMGIWTYTYNALGELTSQTDAKQQTLVMEYDKLGRMIRRYLQSNPNNTEARWVWDHDPLAQGNSHGKSIGKLVQESAPGFVRDRYYDALGRSYRTETRIDGKTYSEAFSYDSHSRPAIKTYPGGQGVWVKYSYNSSGYLEKVSDANDPNDPGVTYWQGLNVNDDGNFIQERIGGILTEHAYDAADGRLDSILTGGQGELKNLAYDFDSQGNLKSRSDQRQGTSESFTYDSLNRLKTVTTTAGGSYSRSFFYDSLGNITSKDGNNYNYNGRPHAVSDAGSHSYSYDANGNLYQGAGRSLIWDHRNRLTQVSDSVSGSQLHFAYDMDGNRYKQVINRPGTALPYANCDLNGTLIQNQNVDAGYALLCQHSSALVGGNPALIINDGALACLRAPQISLQAGFAVRLGGRLRAGPTLNPDCNSGTTTETIHYVGDLERVTHSDGGTRYRHYIRANGKTVAIRITGGEAETRYLFRDHLGSVDLIIDQHGQVQERPSFEAWGKRRPGNWRQAPAPQSIEPRGFTGHEHLDSVGLIHMNGRVYDPDLGRFLSPDPFIQFPDNSQSYNRYSYVLNNPISLTDPSGYCANILIGFIINQMMAQVALEVAPTVAASLGITEGLALQTAIHAGLNGLAQGIAAEAMGGTFAEGFQSGVLNGVQSGIYNGIGNSSAFGGPDTLTALGRGITVKRVLAHGAVGGAFARARGDSFGSGFASGVFSKMTAGSISEAFDGTPYGGAAASAMIGGTASVIGGGKFANGALSSAFGYLYNQCSNGKCWTSSAELSLLRVGDYLGYYKLACRSGDTYACAAGEVAAGKSDIARATTTRLQVYSIVDRGRLLSDAELTTMRKHLAFGYASTLGYDRSTAVQPDSMLISELHWQVFESFGITSKQAFGGTPLGEIHKYIEPFFTNRYPPPYGGTGWCPDCR